jgi:two-component system, NtrC family, nitrogen regulation response regulator NtrX
MRSDQTSTQMTAPHGELLNGASAAMRQVTQQIAQAAADTIHVIVTGEPGTGREAIARAIHSQSHSSGPFVKVDCARMPTNHLEAALFATPGQGSAAMDRRALERVTRDAQIFQSRGGTLFLENIADIPARLQQRLSRVLRDREVVIMHERTRVDLEHRVIAAGDTSLDSAMRDGRILPDLHHRLSGLRINVPPLRHRKEDIPDLSSQFMRALCDEVNVPVKVLSDAANSLITALPWKGNVPELYALIGALVAHVPGEVIELDDVLMHVTLDGQPSWAATGGTLKQARARFEREYIAAVVAQHHGRIADAAKALGIQRSNLYRKMRRLSVRPKFRPT